jgi:hypothetical protein
MIPYTYTSSIDHYVPGSIVVSSVGVRNQSIILSASQCSLLETSVIRMQAQQPSAASELQHLLAVPPTTLDAAHHGNPIAVAHAVLQTIRDAGDERFLFLRTVMEVHQNWRQDQEELFFHCVTGCRQVVLAQWNQYSSAFLRGLRDYFMVLGHHLTQSRTCRLACYTTAVSFWKRGWNDPPKTAEEMASPPVRVDEQALLEGMAVLQAPVLHGKNDLFQYLETLFPSQPQQAAAFLSCLVGEFSGKSAVSYRLPLEFHMTAHRSFEKDGALNHALRLSMQTLGQVVSRCQQVTPQLVEEAHAIIQVGSQDCWKDRSLFGCLIVGYCSFLSFAILLFPSVLVGLGCNGLGIRHFGLGDRESRRSHDRSNLDSTTGGMA